MENGAKVGIICIAYNHGEWVKETLESVALQEYYHKELIVIDNGSEDQTREQIEEWVAQFTGMFPVRTIFLDQTHPYCQLFNESLENLDADYVVDLAGDDVLYPDHILKSVALLSQDPNAAFVFSDAYILDKNGLVRTFYDRNDYGELMEEIELGILYQTLLERSLICAPTMVFNAQILKQEGGYDPNLFYEDFDIQLRLARKYPALFSDHVGVLKRKLPKSMSSGQYQSYHSKMLPSTVMVCEKAFEMNENERENWALGKRVLYELKHALWSANFEVAENLVALGKRCKLKSPKFAIYQLWAKWKVDLSWLYESLT